MKDEELYRLLNHFSSSDIAELSLKTSDYEIKLKKATTVASATVPAFTQSAPVVSGTLTAPAQDSAKSVIEGESINSPLVGTFYSAASPEAEDFVKKGDTVKKGEPLCIVEAMKMLNELPAPYDCEILEIHAKNAELVSFGQVLFTVRKI